MTVYRIDHLTCPAASRPRLMQILTATQAVLRAQPGFVRDTAAQRDLPGGAIEIVTLVEWQNAGALPAAATAVTARHAELGLNRATFLADLGVTMQRGTYDPLQGL